MGQIRDVTVPSRQDSRTGCLHSAVGDISDLFSTTPINVFLNGI